MSDDSTRAAEHERRRLQAERKGRADKLVQDRWPDILTAAGMSDQFFRKSNGPCPFCGGSDRYQWSNKHGGVWVCRKCTDGHYQDGYAMLVKHKGYTYFWQAIDYLLGERDGESPISRLPMKRHEPAQDFEKNLRRMSAIWAATKEVQVGDPVHQYLHRRGPGLNFEPEMIRFHPALEYWTRPPEGSDRPVLLGKFPAMVAKASDLLDGCVATYVAAWHLAGRIREHGNTWFGIAAYHSTSACQNRRYAGLVWNELLKWGVVRGEREKVVSLRACGYIAPGSTEVPTSHKNRTARSGSSVAFDSE